MNVLFQRGQDILQNQPFRRLLGTQLERFEPERAVLSLVIRDELKQQHGFLHGGAVSYLADNALTCARASVLGDSLTVEYKINYLRPAIGERLIARTSVLSAGKRQAVCPREVFALVNGVDVAQGTISKAGHQLRRLPPSDAQGASIMLPKLIITIGAILYGLGVPLLEINQTHVFNPQWEDHARLHEVWQLATNSSLAMLSLWLAWGRNNIKLPSILAMLVTGGFLFSYLVREGYGGSMVLSDGSEKLIFGLNLGAFAFGIVFLLSALVFLASKPMQKQ